MIKVKQVYLQSAFTIRAMEIYQLKLYKVLKYLSQCHLRVESDKKRFSILIC